MSGERPNPSPRRGEGGARSASGEGARLVRKRRSPSPNPLPAGERAIPGEQNLLANDFQNAFGVFEDVVVPEAQHAVAERFDDLGAWSIGFRSVLASVELDSEMRLSAGKVGDMGADRELADELRAFDLPRAEMAPELRFGIRAAPPQPARCRSQALFRQCRTPSSPPSPRRGEGVWPALRDPNTNQTRLNA